MAPRVALLALVLAGCYAEVGAGYYPWIRETVGPAPEQSTDGFAVTFKLGFYLDIPIAPLHSVVGLGVSPLQAGGDAILPRDADAEVTPSGTDLRADVALPFYVFGRVQPRLTLVYADVSGAKVRLMPSEDYVGTGASGSGWFAGGTFGMRMQRGSTLLVSGGLAHQSVHTEASDDGTVPAIDITGTGVAVRLMIAWTPTSVYMKYWEPWMFSSGICAGGYYYGGRVHCPETP